MISKVPSFSSFDGTDHSRLELFVNNPSRVFAPRCFLDNLHHIFILKLMGETTPLGIVLGASSPHNSIFHVLSKSSVDLVASRLNSDSISPRCEHHRFHEVRGIPTLLCVYTDQSKVLPKLGKEEVNIQVHIA